MHFHPAVISILLFCFFPNFAGAGADDTPGKVIFGMDTPAFQPGEFTRDKQKFSVGTAEVVEGKFNKAVKFTFVDKASGGFFVGRVHPDGDWDKADGFSFWVKGDGSSNFGGIELIDRDDYSLRDGYCFPIQSTEWKKIVVPWRELTPELASAPIGGAEGYSPAKFGSFNFGKWFYWRDYPAHSFTIDQIALEPKIVDEPSLPVNLPAGLTRLRAKLRGHQPITIVTMGDSLTDEHHWANRKVVWHHLLGDALKAKYHVDVKIINPAIGGTTLSQNMVLMPRWEIEAPTPDLVTIWFGGNDWASKVRGPRFAEYVKIAVDRIRRQTHGSADILLMTTCPSHDEWDTRKEMEEAVQQVAREKQTGLADVAAAFRDIGSPDTLLKKEYWVWDKVHLARKGHQLTSVVVLGAIESEQ